MKTVLIFSVLLLLAAAMVGCRTITYSDASGNKLEIRSCLWDTSIGSMTAGNGTETISVSNYNAMPDQQALQLADDAIKGVITVAPSLLADRKEKP